MNYYWYNYYEKFGWQNRNEFKPSMDLDLSKCSNILQSEEDSDIDEKSC